MSHPNTSNSPQATLEGAFTLQRRDFVLSVGSLAL
ncbi:MAG: hypothetical protein RIT26_1649, partial [Pseudomonadota bacterium]